MGSSGLPIVFGGKPEFLIVGLGNPGNTYAQSRHNAGAMVVRRIAKKQGVDIDRRRGDARVGEGMMDGHHVVLATPTTFMNDSGKAVQPLVQRFGMPLTRLLIVYDDLDLPLGAIRLRPYGTSGGHNGMKSIISHLGSDRFPRLRIGVGRPEEIRQDTVSYVLGAFRPEEKAILEETLDRAVSAIETILTDGLERAMNRFN